MRHGLALLTLAALTACAGEEEDVIQTLAFDATVGEEAAACGTAYTLGQTGASAQLADARLFLSGIELRDEDGEWVPLTLDATDWQHEGIALLDFEDGTAGCADSGTSNLNDSISGLAPDRTYDAVRFDVGVPFELNHIDSATAPAPLNSPGMFWVWQGGYKFLRVDFAVAGETPSRWNVHVGSTGCVSDGPTDAPAEPCSRPNMARVTLDLDPTAGTVSIDLAALVSEADITTNSAETPPGCMSSPMEPDDCTPVFGALGLDFANGTCVGDCDGQSVFGTN